MSENLLDLSGKIDALTVEIVDAIAKITTASDIRFFLIGATARDLILHSESFDENLFLLEALEQGLSDTNG